MTIKIEKKYLKKYYTMNKSASITGTISVTKTNNEDCGGCDINDNDYVDYEFKTRIPNGGLACCFQAILDRIQLELKKQIINNKNGLICGKFNAIDVKNNLYEIVIKDDKVFCNNEHYDLLDVYFKEPFVEVKWQDIKELLSL